MIKSKKLRIVVTGANGFVAKNVRKLLSNEDVSIFGISRKNFLNYKSETKIISPNLRINDISHKLKNCNALIHLIGTGRQTVNSTYEHVNVENTKKIIQLCKKSKIKKIVYISGLGISNKSVTSYFISKYKAEKEIIESGLDYTILRASYIIGNNDPLTKNLTNQIKKKKIQIPGSGKYHIQPIFVGYVLLNSPITNHRSFNGQLIRNAADLHAWILCSPPGSTVRLEVQRKPAIRGGNQNDRALRSRKDHLRVGQIELDLVERIAVRGHDAKGAAVESSRRHRAS